MKFTMTKKHLVDALDRMVGVGTKGIKTNYEKGCRVSFHVEDKMVVFSTSNGSLDARWEVTSETDANLKCETKGETTVDVAVARKIASAIGGTKTDNLISVYVDSSNGSPSLFMKDSESKAKKIANMVVINDNHSPNIAKPRSGLRYEFETDTFLRAINTVAKYVAKTDYLPRYRMICLHFLKKEIRFICGDGCCFAIYGLQLPAENPDITDADGQKFLLPCDQAQIIASLLSSAKNVEFIYKDNTTCYIKPLNGSDAAMTFLLKGIPNDQYISYEKYSFNFEDAKTIVDLNKDEFLEGMGLIGAVKDKEKLSQSEGFHAANFIVANGQVDFVVDDARFQADYDMPASIYGEKSFSSCYAHDYLTYLAQCSEMPIVRFYCINPKGTVLAEPVEPEDGKTDLLGSPKNKTRDSRLTFFFAAAIEESDSEESE